TRYESANKGVTTSQFHKKRQNEKCDTPLRFLTDVNAAIDVAGVRGGDYTARITRQVRFDIVRIRDVFIHFGFQEESLFDSSPTQLDYEFRYLGIGYKTVKGRIGLFWDHTCYNPVRKLSENKINAIHWNELGIGYKTIGFMSGHKNDGIRFNSNTEWLNTINWKASFSRIWMRTKNNYEWMFTLCIRDDLFRIDNQVFFCQFSLNSIYDNRGINLNPCIEIGDRISFNSNKNIYLTPFVSYKYFHDWYRLGQGEDFLLAGLSLEMALDQKRQNNLLHQEKPNSVGVTKFTIDGGYAGFINNKEYGYKSDIAIDLDLFTLNNDKLLSLYTYIGILTLPHDLNPYIVRYKIGPSLKIDLDNFGIGIFHSYSALYGLKHESAMRDYHLVGLKLEDNNASCWDWDLNIGFYPSSRGFDYWGDVQGSLGYGLLKGEITPYIHFSAHYLQGNSSLFGHAIEARVKIPGNTGNFIIYVCIQDDFDVFRFEEGSQKLLGFRFTF
ncbi:MAG: hypothetical protein JSV09_02895, partial [Thermoplasmata archaeon]